MERSVSSGRVLVVGAGGLGSAALLVLARHGVGTTDPGALGVADGDPVELSNLHRQLLHRLDDVGRPKTDSTAHGLGELVGSVRLEQLPFRLDESEIRSIAGRWDVLVDATDDPETKFLLNDVAVDLRRPLIHAGVIGLEGQVMAILPGRSACLRCLFPEPPVGPEALSCREGGVLGPLASLVGALQAEQAVRVLAGEGAALAGRLISIDLVASRYREVCVRPDAACPVCAEIPSQLEEKP